MDGARTGLTPSGPSRADSSLAALLFKTTLSATVGTLPMFLVGALAIFIRVDLDFGESALGAVASIFYFCAAVGSPPGGHLSERLGERSAMAVAATTTFVACVGIALFAQSWLTLAMFLVLAGIAAGIAQPASSLALARGVPLRHQGMAFGLKQSSGAIATLLGGISVPLLGLTVGWRWAFIGVALLSVPLLRTHRGTSRGKARVRGSKSDVAVRPLRFLALATVFTVMATSSMAPFYVESVVARGIKPAVAGVLFAVGSISAIFARLAWGNIASRRMDLHFVMIGSLQALGAAAFLFMAFLGSVIPVGIATVVMFAAGWGWPGLLTFAVVSRSPKAPALAAGIVGSGQFGGGIVGPLGFGFLVEATSYRVAWMAGAGLMVVGATLSFLGGRYLDTVITQS